MQLSTYIEQNLNAIVDQWQVQARRLHHAAPNEPDPALRGHSRAVLRELIDRMHDRDGLDATSPHGQGDLTAELPSRDETAASLHGHARQRAGFEVVQLVAEFHAMRAFVVSAWQDACAAGVASSSVREVARFDRALDRALAEAVAAHTRDAAASRDMFLAVLGHDLRAPLSGIEMSLMLLARPDLPQGAGQQALQRIGRASNVMRALVADLLDFARSRLGTGLQLALTTCDLRSVCDDALESVRAAYPAQQLVQHVVGDVTVLADAPRLQQVLSNLLGNAVQHGDRSRPITLSAMGSPDTVVIMVSNFGVAIAPAVLPTVFEPMVRGSGNRFDQNERSITSLGLGLYIVREIVQAHGGTVSVRSSATLGTVFTVRLPRTLSTPPVEAFARGGGSLD